MSDDRRLRDAMRRSLARLRQLSSLTELRGIVAAGRPVFVLFTAADCDHCVDAMFAVSDLSRRYENAVTMCRASLEENHDIVLNYTVTEYPSAIVLRRDVPPTRVAGIELAEPGSVRRVLDAASR